MFDDGGVQSPTKQDGQPKCVINKSRVKFLDLSNPVRQRFNLQSVEPRFRPRTRLMEREYTS